MKTGRERKVSEGKMIKDEKGSGKRKEKRRRDGREEKKKPEKWRDEKGGIGQGNESRKGREKR